MNRISISVQNITFILTKFNQIKVYRSSSKESGYVEITTSSNRIDLIPEKTVYFFDDLTGLSTHWYKTSFFNSSTLEESELSEPRLGGTQEDKVGYTFGNYSPPDGEWGDLYTPDDLRYTMLFGVDCIGSDIAKSEFTDEQFRQIVLEAIGEFEAYLGIDIRRRFYRTFNARSNTGFKRSRLWREGVDYTDEDEPYPFNPQLWRHYGFIQLRHFPVIKIHRAIWYSPIQGEIIDFIQRDWVRVQKAFGQVNFYPRGGVAYAPFSVFGQLWSGQFSLEYPGGFEFDYETGYENADFVPEGLRSVIGKYAAIKALAVIGDGLIAGFSSQSISLDGLSETFSSTQSATSAYFGARIKEYQDEIKVWLERNRYKYAPIPVSFVGA